MLAVHGMNFQGVCDLLRNRVLYHSDEVTSQTWQAVDISDQPHMTPWELQNVVFEVMLPNNVEGLQEMVKPNLPWAEDHFQERVSGKPWNPPPSSAWWPHAQANNDQFKADEQFSHTYPERFWPKQAGGGRHEFKRGDDYGFAANYDHEGIRYPYGDLGDLVKLLNRDPSTRQAYLPVWFPEDTGAVALQRVPCTLGYHFMIRHGVLNCNYFIRSCDFIRHFRDDVYMAWRLTQWLRDRVFPTGPVDVGMLTMFIGSLHIFRGDMTLMQKGII